MDAGNYFKFILALVFVLGLIGLLATVVRRLGFGVPQTPFKRAEDKRLGLVEVMPLDAKRRLVLIRRDDVEHLIIMGATDETVVERNINPPLKKPAVLGSTLQKSSVLSNDDDERVQEDAPS